MDRKCYTIILVPHTRARFRKIQVSTVQLWGALAVVLTLTGSASVLGWLYLAAPVDETQVARLHGENNELRQVNQSFEESLRQLQSQLAEYEERTRKLAIVAGIEELDNGGDAGLGGATSTAAAANDEALDLLDVERRMAVLRESLDGVENRLDERVRWISATPTVTPTRGLFTSGFGLRRDPVDGRSAFHEGLDISAPAGKAVHATADGLVVRAGLYGELGNAVVLSHGFGLTTRYGHLSRVTAIPGQRVRRGDLIGYVGNTGRSTGYHLHYEVLEDGKPVNPLAYILDRPTSG
jgi:murein DD-endopeptidase MepM/ murein hydrolase activator NlpD